MDDNESAVLLRDRVFKKLEEDIIDGRYPPGTSLSEKQLLTELGVSRTPLREALAQLELEGLVEFVPHRGVLVLGISHADIDDIYTIKLAMDGLAARLAAQRKTESELAELRETVDLMDFYISKGNLDKTVELDARFHDLICKASKNHPLRTMLANYHNFVRLARQKSMNSPGRLEKMSREHRALYDAIAAGDSDRAQQYAEYHVANAQDSIERAMERGEM